MRSGGEPAGSRSVKTSEPRMPADLVARPRLTGPAAAPQAPGVTLVVAPAGFGKTTLLASWAEAARMPAAWLALDEGDRDPATFLENLAAAMRRAAPGFGEQALAAARNGFDARLAGRALADDLVALDGPILLLLDDYHEGESEASNALLGEIVRWAPPLALVIDSRTVPGIRLARARALGHVRDIGPDDLRFTRSEASAFLAAQGIDPATGGAADRVWEVTEGWPVALRLSSAALRSEGPRRLERLDGLANRPAVREYLIDEVLDRQPLEDRGCMLRLALPARIDAAMVQRLCGRDYPAAAALLERLSDRMRLLTPLEDGGYRYHALVREAFVERLLAQQGPAAVADLRAAAAVELERQGDILEALRLLLAAGRETEAVALAERHAPAAEEQIRPAEALRWIRMLPPNLVAGSPWLLLVRGSSEGYLGQETASEATLGQAEAAMARQDGVPAKERERFAAMVTIKRVFNRRAAQVTPEEAEAAIVRLEAAIAALGADRSLYHTIALYLQARLLHLLGRTSEGIALLRLMQVPPGAAPDRLTANIGVPAAELALWAGQPGLAAELAERAAKDADDLGIANVQASSRAWLGVGRLFRLELAEADAALRYALANRWRIGMFPEREATFAAALLLRLRGRRAEAAQLADRFLKETEGQRDPGWRAGALTFRARLAALDGDLATARDLLAAADRLGAAAAMPVLEDPALTRLQIELQGGGEGVAAARAALPAAIAAAEARHDAPNAIRGRLLLALALAQQERPAAQAAARATLEPALAAALEGGMLLLAAELRGPLRRLLRVSGPAGLAAAAELQAALGGEEFGEAFAPRPLTAREEQMLAGLREGLSRKEIAERYSLSPATVKRHVEKLYTKLGVMGRGEAIAAAQRSVAPDPAGARRKPRSAG